MDKQRNYRNTLLAAVLGVFGINGIALAIGEVDPNDPISSAQPLSPGLEKGCIGIGGTAFTGATVTGFIGDPERPDTEIGDADFYCFQGTDVDVVTIDVRGMQEMGGVSAVDTFLAVFGPSEGGYQLLAWNDDCEPAPSDPDAHAWDPCIIKLKLPAAGIYTVGVIGYPLIFFTGGTYDLNSVNDNGDYTLVISVEKQSVPVPPSVPVQQINIEIKPGSSALAPTNPNSMRVIPVALLSSSQFDALTVDPTTLTFGRTGDEQSWLRCGKGGGDVNGDGYRDLMCHFGNRSAEFTVYDTVGIVKGRKKPEAGGTLFEGRGMLKVVPAKRQH